MEFTYKGLKAELTKHIINRSIESDPVAAQKANLTIDIFTGLPFEENTGDLSDAAKETAFRTHVASLDTAAKADAYIRIMSIPSQEQLDSMVQQAMGEMTRADMEAIMVQAMIQQMGMSEEDVDEYIEYWMY